MKNTIYFVISPIPDLLKTLLAENQPLPHIQELSTVIGVQVDNAFWGWVIQPFLYMKQAGLDVALVEQPVEGAICVTHSDMTVKKIWGPDSFIVGARGDRPHLYMCEIELVQSPANLGGKNVFFMDHWPQYNLIPRNPTRGDRIEQISYFGTYANFSPKFREPSLINALKNMGVELNICTDPSKWSDYSETDLVLAVRDVHPLWLITKPATKLVNAWQAQCVALLGNEPAFRRAGKPGEDYFEVNHPQDVLDIVARLKHDPSLYQHVRQAGIERYPKFSFSVVQQQWIDLLTGPVPEAFARWQKGIGRYRLTRRTQRSKQAFYQWLDRKWFHAQVRSSNFIKSR